MISSALIWSHIIRDIFTFANNLMWSIFIYSFISAFPLSYWKLVAKANLRVYDHFIGDFLQLYGLVLYKFLFDFATFLNVVVQFVKDIAGLAASINSF
jgi:hypothetical protein